MKNIHFLNNYQNSKDFTNYIKDVHTFEGNKVTVDYEKKADYYVILNHPYLQGKKQYYVSEKTITCYNEPIITRNRWVNFTKHENFYHNCNKRNIIGIGISWSYDDLLKNKILKNENKNDYISTITSDLNFLPGHKLRLNFLKYLDNLSKVDIYGRTSNSTSLLFNLKNYRGPLKNRKDDGLFPYKYHFAAENSQENGYMSEKLMDAIFTESLCFYYGAPNATKWINEKSFIAIDISKPEESLEIIKKSIKNNEWEKRIKYIRESKYKIITELSIIPTIEKLIL